MKPPDDDSAFEDQTLADPNDAAEEAPCWIVWERASDGGRPHLRAIDTTEGRAEQHAKYLRNCARLDGSVIPDLLIEESKLNHLYAANLLAALTKRAAKERNLHRNTHKERP